MKNNFRKITIYLILIVLLAGTLRIARAIQEERYAVDAYFYFEMAKDWACYGVSYSQACEGINIPPLLPWLMAMGYRLGISPNYSGLIIGILLGSLMPLAAFWIASNLFSNHQKKEEKFWNKNTYALLAAFLVAVHPFLIRISVSCLREILYLPLIAFTLAFAVSAIYKNSIWRWCVFAFLTALACMSRREAIFIFAAFLIWQIVELVFDRKSFIKNIKYKTLSIILVMLIFLGLMLFIHCQLQEISTVWSPFFLPV